MRVGVPKEIKADEHRVGLIPASVRELVENKHRVIVEKDAGLGIGIIDEEFQAVGAEIAETAEQVFAETDLIIKVKEPQPRECELLREDQVIFTYLHLAADPVQADGLVASGCVAIAYETVTDDRGGLPLLAPMSEVAGRMATQVGAQGLEKVNGGAGILLGGVPGVVAAHVVIIGGGGGGHECRANGDGDGSTCYGARAFFTAALRSRLAVWCDAQHHLCDQGRDRAICD